MTSKTTPEADNRPDTARFRTITITATSCIQVGTLGPDRNQYQVTVPTRLLTIEEARVLHNVFPDLEAGVDKLLAKQALLSCFD